MNEDIPDSRDAIPDPVFDFVRNFMAVLHGHLRIDFDVHVHIKLMSHLSDQAFLYPLDTRDLLSDFAGAVFHRAAW